MSVEDQNQPLNKPLAHSANKPAGQAKGKSIEASEFQAPDDQLTLSQANDTVTGSNRGLIAERSGASWWHSQFNLMLCVFALLGIATLLFITLTPAPTVGRDSTLISASGEASIGQPLVASDVEEQIAPFNESQREQARTDSQEVLAELLEIKKKLEAKEVSVWAQAPFQSALALAEEGDQLYQQQDYTNAIQQYKNAVSSLESIEELVPAELKRRVAEGMAAIREGKSELARERLDAARLLDRNYIPALQGLQRVETLDQVLQLAAAAALDEQDFAVSDLLADIEQAQQKYQQALDLDSQSQTAINGLDRTKSLRVDKQYRLAMSDGFSALFASRYTNARSAFNQALRFKPEDPTAASALRQSLASDKRTSLSSLLSGAQRFEQNEQWASALSNYQTVLQRDRNQVSAKIGRIRSQARVELDKSLKDILSDPLALSRSTERAAAEAVLKDAKGIASKGPMLKQQIAALESSIKQVDSTVKVSFNSDALTQISLKKAGAKRINLGKFDVKNLALKPGRYTVTGTRLGFHDVRTELELNPNVNGVQSFTIACTDQIVDAS